MQVAQKQGQRCLAGLKKPSGANLRNKRGAFGIDNQ
jgi:hypothetical protein